MSELLGFQGEVRREVGRMRPLTKSIRAHNTAYLTLSISRRKGVTGNALDRAEWNRQAAAWRQRKSELLTKAKDEATVKLARRINASGLDRQQKSTLLAQLDAASTPLTNAVITLGSYDLEDIPLTS